MLEEAYHHVPSGSSKKDTDEIQEVIGNFTKAVRGSCKSICEKPSQDAYPGRYSSNQLPRRILVTSHKAAQVD